MRLLQGLAAKDEMQLMVFEKNLSVKEAIDGIKLKKLESTVGEMELMAAISYLLLRFNENFNVGRSITDVQSGQIAADIMEKYPYETLEDIVLMLKQVRQGIIGDGKDYKVDGQNILGKGKWMDQYLDRKYAEVESVKQNESKALNNIESEDHPVAQFYAKRRAQKAKEEKDAKRKAEIDLMAKEMDRQMLEDTITDWEQKPEMKPYLDYLKQKRQTIKK